MEARRNWKWLACAQAGMRCSGFSLELVPVAGCIALAVVGQVYIGQHGAGSKNALDDALASMLIDKDKLPYYNQFPVALEATIIAVSATVGIAALLAILRAVLSYGHYKRGWISSTGSCIYLVLAMPSMVITWLASAWLVLGLIVSCMALLVCYAADQGLYRVSNSDCNRLWQLIQQVFTGNQQITQQFDRYKAQLLPAAAAAIQPGIDAISGSISQPGDACPRSCIDLGTVGDFFFASTVEERCLCNTQRLAASSPFFKRVWRDEVPWLILGCGLVFLGCAWLALDQVAHITRTLADRRLLITEEGTDADEVQEEEDTEAGPTGGLCCFKKRPSCFKRPAVAHPAVTDPDAEPTAAQRAERASPYLVHPTPGSAPKQLGTDAIQLQYMAEQEYKTDHDQQKRISSGSSFQILQSLPSGSNSQASGNSQLQASGRLSQPATQPTAHASRVSASGRIFLATASGNSSMASSSRISNNEAYAVKREF